MKKEILSIELVLILITVVLSGCSEQTSDESSNNSITGSVNTFALSLDDLPSGYSISETNDENPTSDPGHLETYEIRYSYNESNLNTILELGIYKFNTTDRAKGAQNYFEIDLGDKYTEYTDGTKERIFEEIGESTDIFKITLSDSSLGYQTFYIDIIIFRILNLVVTLEKLDWSEEIVNIPRDEFLSAALEFARIIEDRINANI